ncbi:hypothetical protein BU15DRAFT_66788 [Melanogaster broomeanus]|nr:hypothetical protein BU15DRAFT_66788 [Melanogaster broomeanus]
MSVPSEFLNALFIRKSLFFVGHSLLVYNYLLTFSRERFKVEYVWGAPWTVVKATFLLNRYGNVIGQSVVTLEETGFLSHGAEENQFIGIITYLRNVQNVVLVLMRAWAIWGCTYRLAVLLMLLYAIYLLGVVAMATYGATVTSADFVGYQYLDEVGVCIVVIPPLFCVTSGITLMLDTGMFATVMHSLRELTSDSRHLYPSPLLHLLVRDAVAFYIMGLTALQTSTFNNVFTIVCWYLDRKQDPRNMLQLGLSFPLLSIVGQRLVLNLRGLQTQRYTTRDLSREVNRQMAAMGGTSFWQAVEPWPNGAHEAGHEAQSGVGSADLASGARSPMTEVVYKVLHADEGCIYSSERQMTDDGIKSATDRQLQFTMLSEVSQL